MLFTGISCRFSTKNEQQYEKIGEFWDYFSTIYGREHILGLGLNWEKDSLEYIIGTTDKSLEFQMDHILKVYPKARYKEVILPDQGWLEYDGYTNNLGEMYGRIYEDGPLTYEIEAFFDNGRCHLSITREK